MITAEFLGKLNSEMIERGAPNTHDGRGYNKYDYLIMKKIGENPSKTDAVKIAKGLMKYVNTQNLEVTREELDEFIQYNQVLPVDVVYMSNLNGTSADVNWGKYDSQAVEFVKSLQGRRWDPIKKVWNVNYENIPALLEKLDSLGYDISNCIVPKTDKKAQVVKEFDFKDTGEYIDFWFKYNQEIVSLIKRIPYTGRKWDNSKKVWKIKREYFKSFIAKLREIRDNSDVLELVEKTKLLKIENNLDMLTLEPLHESKTGQLQKAEETISFDPVSIPENCKVEPYPFQLKTASELAAKKRMIVGFEQGLGKTLTTLLAVNQNKGKVFIVCPASVSLNWKREIGIAGLDMSRAAIISKIEVTQEIIENNDYFICTYGCLHKHIQEKKSKKGSSFVPAPWILGVKNLIVDEAHYCKAINNSGKPDTLRAKQIVALSNYIENVYLLSGTPITNKTKDIFNMLKMVKAPISNNWWGFATRYCDAKRTRWGWDITGSSNQAELNERLRQFMVRYRKEDVLDLPEKVRSFVPVEVDLKEYHDMLNEYMDGKKRTMGEQLVLLGAMKRILAIQKIPETISFVQDCLENEKPVIVFTCYREVLNKIVDHFKALKVDGSCSAEQRQNAVDAFQNGENNVIVCNVVAGGVGITLTRADVVVFNDFSFTPAEMAQAEDRAHRIGQNSMVNVYYIYCDGAEIDEIITEMVEKKTKNSSKIVDGKTENFMNKLLELGKGEPLTEQEKGDIMGLERI